MQVITCAKTNLFFGGIYCFAKSSAIFVLVAANKESAVEVNAETMPIFGIQIPKSVPCVKADILNPREAWSDKEAYDVTLQQLARMFIRNFDQFTDSAKGKELVSRGPQLNVSHRNGARV